MSNKIVNEEEILNTITRITNELDLVGIKSIKDQGLDFYRIINNKWTKIEQIEDCIGSSYSYVALYNDDKSLFGVGQSKKKS